ncbi:hypothetical protein DY000_02040942 [Brassica cretica]|uniref:Uncharacterized protein n=1 Tax=Brassica cretica TaxID=69181 RepID=A0ABQ7BNW7_BRACR|nr:hypothetical protein DY000_02040942 [Brassica cretica]
MKRGFLGSSKKKPADSCTIKIDRQRTPSIDRHPTNNCDRQSQSTVEKHCSSGTVHQGIIHLGTVHSSSIDTVHPASIDTVHPASIDTAHPDTVHRDTVHPDTAHPGYCSSGYCSSGTVNPVKNDTTCWETEKIEVLIIKVDENGMLRDEEDSTHKSVDISSCDPTSDGDREITIEDFLELEEFLELEDEEKLVDLDSSREVSMEDFLELEEWLEDMDQNSKKKLDDDQHTSRGDLETSKANIERHQPDEIDRQPTHIIDLRPSYIIDRHLANSINLHPPDIDRQRQPIIDRHHPPNIDRCPLVDVLPAESPIPPDRSVHLGSYNGILDDHQHVEASQRGLRFRDEFDKDPAEATSVDTDRIPLNDTNKPASIDSITSPSVETGRISEQKEFDVCGNLRDGDTATRSEKKFIVRSRCFSQPFAKLRALLIAEMIDKGEESMEEAYTQE